MCKNGSLTWIQCAIGVHGIVEDYSRLNDENVDEQHVLNLKCLVHVNINVNVHATSGFSIMLLGIRTKNVAFQQIYMWPKKLIKLLGRNGGVLACKQGMRVYCLNERFRGKSWEACSTGQERKRNQHFPISNTNLFLMAWLVFKFAALTLESWSTQVGSCCSEKVLLLLQSLHLCI